MDIFRYRDDLIDDYSAYVKGFLEVQDPEVEQFITSHLDGGFLWPEPLVQLNPAFVQGQTIDELVDQKRLHPTCREIFRRGKTVESPLGAPLRLHLHQEPAQHRQCIPTRPRSGRTTHRGRDHRSSHARSHIDQTQSTLSRCHPGENRAYSRYPSSRQIPRNASRMCRLSAHAPTQPQYSKWRSSMRHSNELSCGANSY